MPRLSQLSRSIEGKVAIITGAGSGMGRATAHLFADEGAQVALIDVNEAGLLAVQDELSQAGYVSRAWVLDLLDRDAIQTVVADIASHFGRIDILINNAATNPYFGDILDTDLGAYTKTVDVNIRGYFFMCVEGGKLMRDNGGGSIVNTASINALKPGPMQGIYSISKALSLIHI